MVRCAQSLETQWTFLLSRYASAPRQEIPLGTPSDENVISAQQWQDTVATAVQRINAGDLRMVVLAREVRLTTSRTIPCGPLLENLKAAYPQAYLFAFSCGDSCFLGATPERLVRVARGMLNTAALAGTCPRDRHEQQDAELGQALMDSPKDRHEHALVVQTLREALQPYCAMLDSTGWPTCNTC